MPKVARMSDWIAAVILGIVEGITEFIPVSSTGHLLLTKTLLGLPNGFWDTFTVLIQLGAILAVVALYFGKLWKVLIGLPTSAEARWFALSVLIAFMPGAILGLALHDVISQYQAMTYMRFDAVEAGKESRVLFAKRGDAHHLVFAAMVQHLDFRVITSDKGIDVVRVVGCQLLSC